MLQRAASNAYSWWWAGHIRTKQSKWLEQNLQDMEEKVGTVLKLLEEEGDSFAKRAEMYYKRRPELIVFVEDSYRAFRALAERFDHLSTELQNANNTLATCFPEQYQLMDDDDEYSTLSSSKLPKMPPQVPPQAGNGNGANIPKVPKPPAKELKGLIQKATKEMKNNLQPKKAGGGGGAPPKKGPANSGLTESQAVNEIDTLQKDILTLQTEKEFIKSSYQTGLEKYWDIENKIIEKQEKVCKLQDEFNIDKVIEDEEARKLMAETALKSCQETLSQLQETQENSATLAREECQRIEIAREKIKSLRHKFLHDHANDGEIPYEEAEHTKNGGAKQSSGNDFAELVQAVQDKRKKEVKLEKFKEQFDASSMESITVTELVDKIDELVNMVVSLETDVSCQTVLINRLKSESDQLHAQIKTLEDDKATLSEGTHELKKKLKKLEKKLKGIQGLNQNVETQNTNLHTHFAEAQTSLDCLSDKLTVVMPETELDNDSSSSEEQESSLPANTPQMLQEKQNDLPSGGGGEDIHVQEDQDFGASANTQGEDNKFRTKTATFRDFARRQGKEEEEEEQTSIQLGIAETKSGQEFNSQTTLVTGVEENDKILLSEYKEVLKNYNETKRKLCDCEKKDKDNQVEVSMQIRELKNSIAKREEEIQHLRHKMNSLQCICLSQNKDKDNNGEDESKEGVLASSSTSLSSCLSVERKTKPEERFSSTRAVAVVDDDEYEDENDNLISFDHPAPMSHAEEKLRTDIDAILEENLDFWLRFSTSFHQIQKFKSTVEDLQDELSKIRENKKPEESASIEVKSEVRPIYKHLKEIETELGVWLGQSGTLKDELERRFSSLCSIQEKITLALKEGVEEEEIKFSSHQAAKFQGEVLNMKQENNKVRDELQAGVDHITSLQVEVDRTLRKLNEEFRLTTGANPGDPNRPSIPLRSFIFGAKPKKQKASIFSCMHPNRKYQVLRAGVPM